MRRTPTPPRSWILTVLALALLLATLLPATATPVQAASADVVISQVYGGGGNTGATYANDYVELFNRGSSAVSLTGWSVQYAASTGSSWSEVNLSGSLAAGQYLLIQLASGGANGASLPTPDLTGSINLSATDGKVALVTNQTLLTCGKRTNNCFPNATIRDFIGYGSANNYEGSGAAPAPSNTTADLRASGGCTDTDSNRTDFATAAPTPRNIQTALHVCSGGGGGGTGTAIHDIQGAAHTSPWNGKSVSGIAGIVTATTSNGFYLQDPNPDTDPATSEGIFVSTSSTPTVSKGDSITVNGTVSEVRPGNNSTNLTVTTITSPRITVVSRGNPLPAATVVGTGGRIPPTTVIEDDATGNVENSGTFDPANDGIDFWESLEGMLLQVNNAVATGPRNTYNELSIVGDNGANATGYGSRGAIAISAGDFNPERVILDDIITTIPAANTGDRLGTVVGVLGYDFGNFKFYPTAAPTASGGGSGQESTAAPTASELAVATFNTENLDPTDPLSKFDTLASLIVNNLKAPDLVALEEIQDNSGATDNAVVACDQTMSKLIAAIQSAGGPAYQYRQINPVNDQDGGETGGNIREVFMYRTDRGLAFIDRPGGTSTAATTVVNGADGPQLSYSPGRVEPSNSAWSASRKPLAGEFTWNGQKLFVIANHFVSKGGDNPLFGVNQPPVFSSETKRGQQAQLVNNFVKSILNLDANARVIVLGDLNDFQFSQTLTTLKGNELYGPMESLPAAEQYTYVYDGNAQALDHILLSNGLYSASWVYDIVHVNAEFVTRASDHDPPIIRITLP